MALYHPQYTLSILWYSNTKIIKFPKQNQYELNFQIKYLNKANTIITQLNKSRIFHQFKLEKIEKIQRHAIN